VTNKPFNRKYENFEWSENYHSNLDKWKKGMTGIRIVDAAMNELWETGYMHNRTRMITASFLTKNLLIPWQEGEKWFRDTLLDADIANNVMGWQWYLVVAQMQRHILEYLTRYYRRKNLILIISIQKNGLKTLTTMLKMEKKIYLMEIT
jgi:deoxyribodipyrimidine photolyase